jgi:type II secretory pathway predicted ATPase ExeA
MRRPSNLLISKPAALTPSQPPEPEAPKNYVELYGLSKPPFGNAGELAYILFNSHRRAFELIVSHLQTGSGAVLLAGEEGAGKTEMLRAAAEVAGNLGAYVERLFRPASGRLDPADVRAALAGTGSTDRRPAIVIDDADLLPSECLPALQDAMVPQPGSNSAPALVLGASSHASQAQLDQLLRHVQNALRVVPLNPVEVREYIERSLWLAGGTTRRLMDADALKLVIAQSGGMPGVVNRIMDAVLTAGFARSDPIITGKTVAAATGPVTSRRPRSFAPRDLRSFLSRETPGDGLAQAPALPAFVGDLRPRQAQSPAARPAGEVQAQPGSDAPPAEGDAAPPPSSAPAVAPVPAPRPDLREQQAAPRDDTAAVGAPASRRADTGNADPGNAAAGPAAPGTPGETTRETTLGDTGATPRPTADGPPAIPERPAPQVPAPPHQTRIVRPNSGNTTVVRPQTARQGGRQAADSDSTRTQISNETVQAPGRPGGPTPNRGAMRAGVREGFGKAADRAGRIPPTTTTVVDRLSPGGGQTRQGLFAAKTDADARGAPRIASDLTAGLAPRQQTASAAPGFGRLVQLVSIGLFVAGVGVFSYRALFNGETPSPAPPQPAPAAAPVQAAPTPQAAQTTPPASPLPPGVMEALLKRGAESLTLGDVAAARLFYQRAAEAGNGMAAMALGRTYDPTYTMRGSTPDPARAAEWYRKAIAAGDPTAPGLLQKLNGS